MVKNEGTADRPDVLIVGAGIAGLYTAREILKRSPTTRVLVIEKYPVVGGRVLSFRKCIESACEKDRRGVWGRHASTWEAGAGRLHYSQKRVHALLKEYGLKVFPLSASADFISAGGDRRQPNNFADLLAPLLPLLADLPVADLQMHTLADLCTQILGPKMTKVIFDQFPYYTEVYNLRADLALETFKSVMGSEGGFCSIKGGFGQLPQALAADVRRRGGSIWLGAELTGWVNEVEKSGADKNGGSGGHLKAQVQLWRNWRPHTTVTLYPKRMILALHAGALQAFPQCRKWAPLKHLGVARLLRIYAVFPLGPVCGGAKGPWFTGMSKIVVAGPLRYIIPINEAAGIIMISYTDGGDTQPFWREAEAKNPAALTRHIMREVRALFGPSIPDPLFLKAHPWTVGTTYWRPGRYDVDAVMQESLQLEDGVACVGESFSREQAWIEGALESAERLLAQPNVFYAPTK